MKLAYTHVFNMLNICYNELNMLTHFLRSIVDLHSYIFEEVTFLAQSYGTS